MRFERTVLPLLVIFIFGGCAPRNATVGIVGGRTADGGAYISLSRGCHLSGLDEKGGCNQNETAYLTVDCRTVGLPQALLDEKKCASGTAAVPCITPDPCVPHFGETGADIVYRLPDGTLTVTQEYAKPHLIVRTDSSGAVVWARGVDGLQLNSAGSFQPIVADQLFVEATNGREQFIACIDTRSGATMSSIDVEELW
jgi:hypothetical protein